MLYLNTLQWLHNGRDSVSNQQPHNCLLNRLFICRSKKTSKLRVAGLCAGNSPGTGDSPHKGPVTRKMFPFDDVIMSISVNGRQVSSPFAYFGKLTFYCVLQVASGNCNVRLFISAQGNRHWPIVRKPQYAWTLQHVQWLYFARNNGHGLP